VKELYFNKTYIKNVEFESINDELVIFTKRCYQIKDFTFIIEDIGTFITIEKNGEVIGLVGADCGKNFHEDSSLMLELCTVLIENYSDLPFQIGTSNDSGFLKVGNYFLTDCDPCLECE